MRNLGLSVENDGGRVSVDTSKAREVPGSSLEESAVVLPHITVHFESSLDLAGLTWRATLAASVKASLTPRFRMAEHSAS